MHNSVKHPQYTFHELINSNVEFSTHFAEETNLIIANTTFIKRKGRLYTYMSESNAAKYQIYFIMICRK